ncbi:hypothetical protein HZH68_016214 [Vespula germanica]|uniref:Uncharacterized protein n=1 Tax=Vespula germanica TaxID=30212 RepID=A0A834J203_VESGE|nr:hypothetical protein HZH68_016214 [Vespula germanica]
MTIKHSTSELKQIYIATSCCSIQADDRSYVDNTNVQPSTRLGNKNIFLFPILISKRFYDGDGSISIDKWDIRSLNTSYPETTPLVHINQET